MKVVGKEGRPGDRCEESRLAPELETRLCVQLLRTWGTMRGTARGIRCLALKGEREFGAIETVPLEPDPADTGGGSAVRSPRLCRAWMS
jgi:hypothetical protein